MTVFELFKGECEYFDLSKLPIERFRFVFGGQKADKKGRYNINGNCTMCGACLLVRPSSCVMEEEPFRIVYENCLHCGNCYSVCKFEAVDK